ncbi:hypothetical protein MUK42_19857 [Musa troglodytarum]|uniref:Uncharacterized protein n=1 Tax=Musa troglodytarum TaxID=320322 RepID=A0A9E7FU99_9LILI|nr:hypothetical protein MUK42_19857 [Musa troglodytarum]
MADTETKGRAIKDMAFVVAVEDSDDERHSAPETPNRYDDVYRSCISAPSSPVHGTAIHAHGVPFDWEEKPGIPKWLSFSKTLEKAPEVAVADEGLFEEERILVPLKPPPRLNFSRTDDGAGSASSSTTLDEVPEVAAADEVLEEERILQPLKPPPRLYFSRTDDGAGSASSSTTLDEVPEVAAADEVLEEERILQALKPPPRLYFSRTDDGAGSASSSKTLDEVPEVAAADEVLKEECILQPLKPPPRLHFPRTDDGAGCATSTSQPPRHHRSKMFRSRLNQGRKELDPFTIAMMEATRDVPGSDDTNASSSKKWPWKKILSLGLLSNKKERADSTKTDAVFGSTQSHDSAHGMESATEGAAQGELMRTSSIVLRQGQLSCIPFSLGARRRRRRRY